MLIQNANRNSIRRSIAIRQGFEHWRSNDHNYVKTQYNILYNILSPYYGDFWRFLEIFGDFCIDGAPFISCNIVFI